MKIVLFVVKSHTERGAERMVLRSLKLVCGVGAGAFLPGQPAGTGPPAALEETSAEIDTTPDAIYPTADFSAVKDADKNA